MTLHWTSLCIAIVSTMPPNEVFGQTTSTESSAEYLHNVMSQLQEHNRPSPMSVDRTTGPGIETALIYDRKPGNHELHRGNQQTHQPDVRHQYFASQNHDSVPDNGEDDHRFMESAPHYYQVPAPQTISRPAHIAEPEPLGLTREELATMYKNALEKGSAVSLSSLTNAVASGHAPKVTGNHLHLSSGQPAGYYYYYYPLKSFMSELQNNHGYKTIQYPTNTKPEESEAVESSEKQMVSPLFMAISGFIGMAMMFMIGVIFLPRFGGIKSRGIHDEFLQLTKIAGEAIDGRNCSERFACELGRAARTFHLPLGSFRYLETWLPTNLGRQVARVRRSAKSPRKCRLIACRKY